MIVFSSNRSRFSIISHSSVYIELLELYFILEERCYKVDGKENGKSWNESAEFCRHRGGHLVSIQSKEELGG